MEPGENIVGAAQPEPGARGCYKANLVLNAFIALGLAIAIVLILNVFNRSGWFALLSGLFGALLYCAIVFPRLLFGPMFGPRRRNYGAGNIAEIRGEQGDRHSAKRMALRAFAISGILAIGASIGLYYFPANRPIFAFLDAVLAIVICIALLAMGFCILVFFFGHAHTERNGGHVNF